MKFLGASLFLFLISAVVGSAQAACGGGGWHSNTSSASTAVRETPVVSSSEDRHVVSASVGYAPRNSDTARPAAKNDDPSFNTARFDSVAPRLNLSEKQISRIDDVKDQVREDLQDLRHAVTKAETRLARCYGNCDDEKQNLARANDAMKNFTGSVEFERRLQTILNQEQLATYHDADSAR